MNVYCECEVPVMDVEHDPGCRRCGRPVNFSPRALRDATAVELMDEPDGTLELMAQGDLECTATTRLLAREELDARRLRPRPPRGLGQR